MDDKGNDKFVLVCKILITVCAREPHLFMLKPVEEGGFTEGRDNNGLVRFSEKTLRTYWPNWLKAMTDADKAICGCSTCCDTDDINDAYNGKRRKLAALYEVRLEELGDSIRYDQYIVEPIIKKKVLSLVCSNNC